jgi:hypothetical protein
MLRGKWYQSTNWVKTGRHKKRVAIFAKTATLAILPDRALCAFWTQSVRRIMPRRAWNLFIPRRAWNLFIPRRAWNEIAAQSKGAPERRALGLDGQGQTAVPRHNLLPTE